MLEPLFFPLIGFMLIQLLYYLIFFTRLAFYSRSATYAAATPGVTILVCAWNERENLEALLPILDQQDYPNYEVILLDDRSDDGSEEFIRERIALWKNIKYIRINDHFKHITPKKYALSVGMKQAQYPITLMTDADCRPSSNRWIRAMVSGITVEKDIVLGFSPYFKYPGLLNWFIRCETFYAAVQYLSFSLAGFTYMGVGRNILYKKSVFFENKGFYRHSKIYGGDDDLFLNEVATRNNTTIAVNPDSYMYSIPKFTWSAWYRQKRRHLSVSHYYRLRNKLLLGLLSMAHIFIWIIGIAMLTYGIVMNNVLFLQTLGIIWAVRWLLQGFILTLINVKLDKTIEWFSFLPMDFALFLYYFIFGIINITKRKPKTSWN